jgi:APA family basic amino acid/polyamine antiporter
VDQLPRRLGLLDATLIVIGIVIGVGIFLLPNVIAQSLPSGSAIIAVWLAAGALSYCGALAYAELGAMMPATGGQYIYLREAFGGCCGFLGGWVGMFAVVPGGVAFLAVGFSIYLGAFVRLSPRGQLAVAISLVTVLSAANYLGIKEGAWIQRIFTSLKIGGILLLIGAAAHAPRASSAPGPALALSYSGIGLAVSACLMAYNGWSYVSFVAGELKDPQRNLPRALALGMTLVIALYVGANLAYLRLLPVAVIAHTERVGAEVAARAMGPMGGPILSVVVLLSIIGAINGNILTGARIPFAQAQDGLFFARFGRMHPRFRTPGFAIAAQAVWTCGLILTGSYQALFAYAILSAWLFYTLSVVAVWVLRRRAPDAPRPYRMWGYPYTLWAFLLASLWFMGDALINQPKPSLIAFGMTLLGIPFYFFWRRKLVFGGF